MPKFKKFNKSPELSEITINNIKFSTNDIVFINSTYLSGFFEIIGFTNIINPIALLNPLTDKHGNKFTNTNNWPCTIHSSFLSLAKPKLEDLINNYNNINNHLYNILSYINHQND